MFVTIAILIRIVVTVVECVVVYHRMMMTIVVVVEDRVSIVVPFEYYEVVVWRYDRHILDLVVAMTVISVAMSIVDPVGMVVPVDIVVPKFVFVRCTFEFRRVVNDISHVIPTEHYCTVQIVVVFDIHVAIVLVVLLMMTWW